MRYNNINDQQGVKGSLCKVEHIHYLCPSIGAVESHRTLSVVTFSPAEGARVRATPGGGVTRVGVSVRVAGADMART